MYYCTYVTFRINIKTTLDIVKSNHLINSRVSRRPVNCEVEELLNPSGDIKYKTKQITQP